VGESYIDWKKFKYMVFDAPKFEGTYEERYNYMGIYLFLFYCILFSCILFYFILFSFISFSLFLFILLKDYQSFYSQETQ